MGSSLTEEDKLLASLPELFEVLVTALEACPDVPTMDVVTELLLQQERKLNGLAGAIDEKALAMKGKQPKKKGPCHHCDKMGHYKRDCWKLVERKTEPQKEGKSGKHKISLVTEVGDWLKTMRSWRLVMLCQLVLRAVESGNISHVYLFAEYNMLQKPGEVSVGDGRVLEVAG